MEMFLSFSYFRAPPRDVAKSGGVVGTRPTCKLRLINGVACQPRAHMQKKLYVPQIIWAPTQLTCGFF